MEFVTHDDLGTEVTFLWDPSFDTWRNFGVRTNSSMALLASDLSSGSNVFYGFGDNEQAQILEALPDFS